MYIMSYIVACVCCSNCYRLLKVSSKESVLKERRQQKEPSGNHPSQQPREHAVLNTLTPTGLENSLTTLREQTECSAKLKLCTLPVVGMHPISPVYCLLFIIAWGVLECQWRWFVFLLADEKLVAATHNTDFITVVLEKWSSDVVRNLFCVCTPASFSDSQNPKHKPCNKRSGNEAVCYSSAS